MIKSNAGDLADSLSKKYAALGKGSLKGIRVGSFGVPYASYHEFGTKWSNRMPYGFFAAVRNQKQRSPSKNVMQFSGKGRNRIARLKARPFFRPAIEAHRDRIAGMLSATIARNPETLEKVLNRIGMILVTQIARNIRNPPKPEGGARGPIANTGALLNSIRYEIMR